MRTADEVTEDELRDARIAAAKKNPSFRELEAVDLVPRGPRGWVVSAASDQIFKPHLGVVFEPATSNLIADRAELFYYVTDDGLVFLERVQRPATWSAYVERQARRSRVAT